MALIRDVTAKEREIHSSIIVLLDVRKEATMCIIPVVPISKFTRILTSTGKLFAGEGSLQNNSSSSQARRKKQLIFAEICESKISGCGAVQKAVQKRVSLADLEKAPK